PTLFRSRSPFGSRWPRFEITPAGAGGYRESRSATLGMEDGDPARAESVLDLGHRFESRQIHRLRVGQVDDEPPGTEIDQALEEVLRGGDVDHADEPHHALVPVLAPLEGVERGVVHVSHRRAVFPDG